MLNFFLKLAKILKKIFIVEENSKNIERECVKNFSQMKRLKNVF